MLELFLIDAALLFLVTLTAIAAVSLRNLVAAVMMLSIYSLLIALVWVNNDAVDVAFTEAAVGAGISSILLLGTLVIVGNREKSSKMVHAPALAVVALTGAALIYGTLDMPEFGDPKAPVHSHPIAKRFTEQDVEKDPRGKSGSSHDEAAHDDAHGSDEAHGHDKHAAGHGDGHHGDGHHGDDYFHGHVDNMVTSVIVSYRAYDTLFETAVIFTAGLGMILLLRGRRGSSESGGIL